MLEDDAYHYLSFDPDHLVPSYFELEAQDGGQQGRVLRFDSFSKILSSGSFVPVFYARTRTTTLPVLTIKNGSSSGMRLGFVTGPQPLLEIIDLHTSNTNLQPS